MAWLAHRLHAPNTIPHFRVHALGRGQHRDPEQPSFLSCSNGLGRQDGCH